VIFQDLTPNRPPWPILKPNCRKTLFLWIKPGKPKKNMNRPRQRAKGSFFLPRQNIYERKTRKDKETTGKDSGKAHHCVSIERIANVSFSV